eukprot:3931665-Ditylum_brightwellii.AAC.1
MMTTYTPLKQPCMKYEAIFKHSDIEKIKLFQNYDDGTTHNKKCLIFTDTEGIKGLLYIEERFRGIAWQLTFDTGPELFNNFEEVITNTIEDKWDEITGGILPYNRDPTKFDESIKKFYLKYYDKQARDTMLEYLRGLRPPTKVQPRDYSNIVELLVRYSNQLPGLNPAMTDEQTKKLIFDQHPEKWRIAYNCSGQAIETDTLADIIQFMSDEKEYADNEEEK